MVARRGGPGAGLVGLELAAGVVVLLAYADLLDSRRRFVSWDDRENFVQNEHLRGGLLDLNNIRWALTSWLLGVYEPVANAVKLAIVTLTEDILFSGGTVASGHVLLNNDLERGSPLPILVVSLFLHVTNLYMAKNWACQRAKVVHGMNSIRPSAGLVVALLVALHPLRVEAVAWCSCLPYLLAVTCGLASLRAHTHGNQLRHLLFLSFAILCKAPAVSLVAIPLLDDFLIAQRQEEKISCSSALFTTIKSIGWSFRKNAGSLLISISGCGVAGWANNVPQPSHPEDTSFVRRCIKAGHSWWWYVRQTIWPRNLDIGYDTPEELHWLPAATAATVLLVAAASVVWLGANPRRSKSIFFLLSIMLLEWTAVLLPCLGFVKHGYRTIAADRYSYMPSFAVLVPYVTLIVEKVLAQRDPRRKPRQKSSASYARWLMLGAATGIASIWAMATAKQTLVWRSSTKLWSHSSSLRPDNAQVSQNLAMALSASGEFAESRKIFQRAIAQHPDRASFYNNYGAMLDAAGSRGEAERAYKKAISIDPGLSEAVGNLAINLHARDQQARAMEMYQKAIEIAERQRSEEEMPRGPQGELRDPDRVLRNGAFWLGYGFSSSEMGHNPVAMFRKATELAPHIAEAHYRLAKYEPTAEAITKRFLRALRLDPSLSDAVFALANHLQRTGAYEKALPWYEKAIALEPGAVDIRMNYALALRASGRFDAAREQAEKLPHHPKAVRLLSALKGEAAKKQAP